MNFPRDIDCYMIVVKDNPTSEFYANYCINSWEAFGRDVKRFDAITPDTLNTVKSLKWSKYSQQYKYVKSKLKVEITKTERACFASHYSLWSLSAKTNKPLFILEHDAFLEKPDKLWYDEKYAMIHFDAAAMGSYVIMPWFARRIIHRLRTYEIASGPYGFLYRCAQFYKIEKKYVNSKHPLYYPASNQVMSAVHGNTVDHYINSSPDMIEKFGKHKFKMI